jgi:hypothetical protein
MLALRPAVGRTVSRLGRRTLPLPASRVGYSVRSLSVMPPPTLDVDKPYPIWFLDQDGGSYKFLLSVARTFSGILESIHDVTGLPWWGTIVLGSLLVRVVFFPVNCYALRNASRFFDARGDLQALQRSHRTAVVTLVRLHGRASFRSCAALTRGVRGL